MIFHCLNLHEQTVDLHSNAAGIISIKRQGEWIEFSFPTKTVVPVESDVTLISALGFAPIEAYHSNHDRLLVVVKNEQAVREFQLEATRLAALPYRGIIMTVASCRVEFVSRTFYLQKPVMEDAVTGASHCYLAPYWAKRLAKKALHVEQISARGGMLLLEAGQAQILIKAQAVLYVQSNLNVF